MLYSYYAMLNKQVLMLEFTRQPRQPQKSTSHSIRTCVSYNRRTGQVAILEGLFTHTQLQCTMHRAQCTILPIEVHGVLKTMNAIVSSP